MKFWNTSAPVAESSSLVPSSNCTLTFTVWSLKSGFPSRENHWMSSTFPAGEMEDTLTCPWFTLAGPDMENCAAMEIGNSRTIRVLKNRIIVVWVFGIMGGLFFGALQVELWIHQ